MTTLLFIGTWPFAKFVGFLLFLIVELIGFWCLAFLVGFLPYWLTYGVAENRGKINADVKPEDVRRKTLPQQEGIEVVYVK